MPQDAKLYDYNLGNPHVVFYLKRDIKKIDDFKGIQEGAYILVRKGNEILLPCEIKEIQTFRARSMVIGVYKKEEGCL